jgi:crotonobetainyl-CoA:carnitine CoA-transferase CaiB-like acyl-CoA transferase
VLIVAGDKVAQAERQVVGLLSCLRVVECSPLGSAPVTTPLADLGADVIKVEALVGGAGRRVRGPNVEGDSRPGPYVNRGKRSIALDLANETGRAIFLELIEVADAMVETLQPGGLRHLGLGYERLREANPRIVLLSVIGYGAAGYWHDLPGDGSTAGLLAGTTALLAGILWAQQENAGCHLEMTGSSLVGSKLPTPDEHSETILRDVLGYNTEGIAELRRSGALGSP